MSKSYKEEVIITCCVPFCNKATTGLKNALSHLGKNDERHTKFRKSCTDYKNVQQGYSIERNELILKNKEGNYN